MDDGGNLRLLIRDLTQPNGLAFPPDGKAFYVDNSEQRNIRAYDVAADGNLQNGRIFGDEHGEKNDSVPDGIKVDGQGNLFVTGPRGIWVGCARQSPWHYHHAGTAGESEGGDNDHRTLYITATTSVYRLETKRRALSLIWSTDASPAGPEHVPARVIREVRS